MKDLTALTAEETIAELEAPKVGPGYTRRGLIVHLVVVGMLKMPDWQAANRFLEELKKTGSNEDKMLLQVYFR